MGLPAKGPGRPLGSKNKAKRLVRDAFNYNGIECAQELIDIYLENKNPANEDYDPKFAAYILIQMLPYVYPKLKEGDTDENDFDDLSTKDQIDVLQKLIEFLKGK